jgi:phosphatidylinositol glycan class H protein
MPTRLTVRRPSPSTVCFTVSNAPSRRTWPAKLAFCVELLLRILVFTFVLLVDAAKLRHAVLADNGLLDLANYMWSTSLGAFACHLADQYRWSVVAGVSAVLIYAVWRKGYTGGFLPLRNVQVLKEQPWLTLACVEESLLVIRGLGIQTSTSSAMYWSSAATRFIPTTQIQDIVIHEAFKGFEVRFYLAVIVEGEPDVVVVFPVSLQVGFACLSNS